jgi:hypothetical protein
MGYAEDTSRLCQEIKQMHMARIELKGRLNRFAADLCRNMNEQRAAMRKQHADTAAMTKSALASFVADTRRMMNETLGNFARERHNAHGAWMRMSRGR